MLHERKKNQSTLTCDLCHQDICHYISASFIQISCPVAFCFVHSLTGQILLAFCNFIAFALDLRWSGREEERMGSVLCIDLCHLQILLNRAFSAVYFHHRLLCNINSDCLCACSLRGSASLRFGSETAALKYLICIHLYLLSSHSSRRHRPKLGGLAQQLTQRQGH